MLLEATLSMLLLRSRELRTTIRGLIKLPKDKSIYGRSQIFFYFFDYFLGGFFLSFDRAFRTVDILCS